MPSSGQNDATRLLGVINNLVEQKTKSGAHIEVTYGQVFQLSGSMASVYLAGSRELALADSGVPEPSEDFRVPAWMGLAASDYVRVSMDARGHRWIDEQLPTTAVGKVRINSASGVIEFGDGATYDVNLYRNGVNMLQTDDQFRVISGSGITVVSTAAAGAFRTFNDALDTQPKFKIGDTGILSWGAGNDTAPDVSLYRLTTNYLTVGAGNILRVKPSLASDFGFDVHLGTESSTRFRIYGDGDLSWGDGTNAHDATIGRTSASVLGTGVGDSLLVSNPTTSGGSGVWLNATGSIEIVWNLGTPFIDFKNAQVDDYDSRIIYNSNASGLLEFMGANVKFNTTLTATGVINGVDGLQINGVKVARYVALATTIQVANGLTTTADTGIVTSAEMTALPLVGVVAVQVTCIAQTSVIATGTYVKASDFDGDSGSTSVMAYSSPVANYNNAGVGMVRTGGTNNRQMKYQAVEASTGTLTYWVRVWGYWTTE